MQIFRGLRHFLSTYSDEIPKQHKSKVMRRVCHPTGVCEVNDNLDLVVKEYLFECLVAVLKQQDNSRYDVLRGTLPLFLS